MTRLVPAPARILDAGCGTGRIAVRLDELGYDVVGVDVDPAMLDVARAEDPESGLADRRPGDVRPRRDASTWCWSRATPSRCSSRARWTTSCARLAAHVVPGGLVVCGFGLDDAHLPGDCPPTPLADVEAAMAAAGLVAVDRFGTWDGDPFDPAAATS